MVRASVVIIDDHELIRDAWTVLLESTEKFRILEKIARSEEVERRIKQLQPDLVLLDVNMSPVDGFEVLRIIKSQSPTSKVIAVSIYNQLIYARRMMKEGAKGYVTKNSSANELLNAIDVVMKGSKYVCKEIRHAITEQVFEEEDRNVEKLTGREIDIVKHLRTGLSSKEIADKLSITVKTVQAHRYNIFKKLQVKNAIAAIEVINSLGI